MQIEKLKRKINKTERILSIYHLLMFCEEVSTRELTQLLPGSKKTFYRDIALLKKAGVQVRYSVRRQAFTLTATKQGKPDFPESKSETRYIEKIIRLMTVMDDMPDEDCDIWYMAAIPGASKRTMQRDFATLAAIGYKIMYERKTYNSHNAGFDLPTRRYYCDKPYDTYGLATFRRDYNCEKH